MGKFFSIDSPVMRSLSFLGDMMLLNVIFIVCSIPVVTIGASASALYTVALSMAADNDRRTVREFFKAFRGNFLKATAEWMILLVLAAVEYTGVMVIRSGVTVFPFFIRSVYILVAVVIWLTASWVFAIQAKFENTVFGTLKNAVILGILHPVRSVAVMALTALIPALFLFYTYVFLVTSFIWFVFGFSGIAIINSIIFNKVFDRIIRQNDNQSVRS